nr:hypothetical protein L204_01497 [Cryptococcus depauperatus CBS 7855]
MLYLLQEYDQSSCQQNKPSKEKKGSNDDKKIVQEVAEQRTFHAQLQVPCIRSCVLPAAHPTVCSTSSTHFLTAKHDVRKWGDQKRYLAIFCGLCSTSLAYSSIDGFGWDYLVRGLQNRFYGCSQGR